MEKTFHTAFLEMQKDFPLIKKTENNPFFKSKYAGLPQVLEVVLPILHKHEFYLTQSPVSELDRVGVKTTITYKDGTSISDLFVMTLAKEDPQGAGSAITYARRYAIVSMLGLNVDEDDDGETASGRPPKKMTNKEKIMNTDYKVVPTQDETDALGF